MDQNAQPLAPETVAEAPVAEAVSRADFDCPECGGEGLKSQDQLCPVCNGTGKSQVSAESYPEGTVQLRQDGQYIFQGGKFVKQ